MLRFHGVMFAAAGAAAILSGGAALADSRIFTVKASEPGVTIVQAFRNGTELAIAGQGDGSTLFRIDEPNTIVACANRFDFVTSTGEKVNLAADMCVLNWEVTVDVAAAPTPPAPVAEEPPPPAEPPAASAEAPDVPAIPPIPAIPEVPDDTGAPPAATATPTTPDDFTQVVTVAADDPSVTITGLSLDGAPVAITGRGQGTVQFEIAGSEQGIVCQRNLGLTLSDGRQVAQAVNLCLNDWRVTVAVAGAAPGGTLPVPPLPGGPGSGVTALPTAPPEGMAWTFAAGEIAGTLVHGIPETDATAFVATCNRGSDRIRVTLYDATAPGLAPGAAVPVTFFAGGFTKSYQGTMTAVLEQSGVSHPEVVISAGDPLWSALIRETNIGISAGPAYSATLSLKGSAAPTRQLLATCLNAPTPPPPVATTPGGQGGGGGGGGQGITARYACEIGPGFRITYLGNKGIAVLNEQGAPPLTLQWMPEGMLGRYVAGDARLVLREDHVRWSRFGERPRTCFPR